MKSEAYFTEILWQKVPAIGSLGGLLECYSGENGLLRNSMESTTKSLKNFFSM
jgi:hypothetical protein